MPLDWMTAPTQGQQMLGRTLQGFAQNRQKQAGLRDLARVQEEKDRQKQLVQAIYKDNFKNGQLDKQGVVRDLYQLDPQLAQKQESQPGWGQARAQKVDPVVGLQQAVDDVSWQKALNAISPELAKRHPYFEPEIKEQLITMMTPKSELAKAGKTQGPAAQVFVDTKGKPWQMSRVEGNNVMVPYKVGGGGQEIPSKFVPPKAGQVLTDGDGAKFVLEPGSNIAKPIEKGKPKKPGDTFEVKVPLATKQKYKAKLTTINVARTQIKNVQAKFDAIKNTLSAGPFGSGKVPTKAGRAFDRAVDALRQTFRSLTRTPGEGAMSDMETKLATAAIPIRNEYEDVTQQQIDQLITLIDTIEKGYSDMSAGKINPSSNQSQGVYSDDKERRYQEWKAKQ